MSHSLPVDPDDASQGKKKGKGSKKKGGGEAEEFDPAKAAKTNEEIRAQIVDWHTRIAGDRTPSSAFKARARPTRGPFAVGSAPADATAQAFLDRAARGEPPPSYVTGCDAG